jgi:hypothetical protein
LKDYDDFLERLVPHEPTSQYRHNDTGEDNADAHIKRQVMGREAFTVNLTAAEKSACWSRSSGSRDKGQTRNYFEVPSASRTSPVMGSVFSMFIHVGFLQI